MKKILLTLIVMFAFMMNANAQMTKVSIDTKEKVTSADKFYGYYLSDEEKKQEEARLKKIVIRDVAKYKDIVYTKDEIDRLSILIDTKFENDGFLNFWWTISFPIKKDGVTTIYYGKFLYMHDKMEGTINPERRQENWHEIVQ